MQKFVLLLIALAVSFSGCKTLKKKKCDCPDHRRKKGVAFISVHSQSTFSAHRMEIR